MRFLAACCLSFSLLCSAAFAAPTWHNVGPGGGGWIESICASPHDTNELFAGCDIGGFYRSTDGGKNYRIYNTGLRGYCPERIAPHPRDPNVIYLGCSRSHARRPFRQGRTLGQRRWRTHLA